MHPRFAFIGLALAMIALVPSQASAEAGGAGWTDGAGVGADSSSAAAASSTSSGKSSGVICTSTKMEGADAIGEADSLADQGVLKKGSDSGAWYYSVCKDAAGNQISWTTVWVADTPSPATLAQQAFDYTALPLPDIELSPSADHPQLVNLATWLSIGSASWKPITASASAGGVTVTTTATPTTVTWSTGDGGHMVCNGPGVVYDPSKPDAAQHSDCSYAFRHSSSGQPNGRYTLTATVSWRVEWTATGVPAGGAGTGDLGAVSRSSSVGVQVTEVQALNQVAG